MSGMGSENSVRTVLRQLTEHGLVRSRERGKMTLYQLNQDHLAYPAVEVLTNLRSTLIKHISDQIADWVVVPLHAALYGSAARADGGTGSDIDLLIVHRGNIQENDQVWENQISQLREHVYAWTGNHSHILELDQPRLRAMIQSGEAILTDWAHDAISLYGPQTRDLLKEYGWLGR